jgi:hypothetical protein
MRYATGLMVVSMVAAHMPAAEIERFGSPSEIRAHLDALPQNDAVPSSGRKP